MVFDVVAATEEAANASLQDHIDNLATETPVSDMETEMEEARKVEQPHPELDEGYSQLCEVECTVNGFAALVDIIINYGPTSVDITAPEQVTMEMGEVRDALNEVAQMMHQFLQSGAGGMMI